LHPEFARVLHDLGLPATYIGQDVPTTIRQQALRDATHILAYMDTLRVSDERLGEGILDWLNTDYPAYLYARLGDFATIAYAIDAYAPSLVLVHNDVEPLTRMAALWAKSHAVPCLHVPHAIYIDGFDRGEVGCDIHDIVTASHICVAGPYQKDWYDARGGNTIPTGLPQFDKWARIASDRVRSRELLGLDPYKPVVTFASSWRQDTNLAGCHDGLEEAYLNFLSAARSLPDVQYIIKLHPRGNNAEWHLKLAQATHVDCLVTALHLEHVLAASNGVIAYGPSNLLIEAAYFPLQLMSLGGFQDDPEINTITSETDELRDAIQYAALVAPSDLKAFTYKYAGIPDGLATNRIIGVALQLLPEVPHASPGPD
jgi:hypothetical protein